MSTYIDLVKRAGDYKPIVELKMKSQGNFYGVVVNKNEPKPTKGSDFVMSIVVSDPSIPPTVNGISINVFRAQNDFPTVSVGSKIRISCKINAFGSRLQGVVSKKAPDSLIVLDPRYLTEDEKLINQALDIYATSVLSNSISSTPSRSKRPLLRIEEISESRYFDLYCKVTIINEVVSPPIAVGPTLILGITDFTSNPELEVESEFLDSHCNFPHDITVALTCWDEYADMNFSVGMYLKIENVRNKTDSRGRMEFAVSGGSMGKRNAITLLDQSSGLLKELREREEAYLENCSQHTKSKLAARPVLEQKNSNIESNNETYGGYQPVASKQLPPTVSKPRPRLPPTVSKPINKNALPKEISPISQIISSNSTVPFIYRLKVRVIDHIPFSVNDFTRFICQGCHKSFTALTTQCDDCDSDDLNREYMFSLLLTDGTGELPVILSGDDAIEFFHDVPASQISNGQLREFLSNLWVLPKSDRDLRVKSPKEFDCFVKSYSVIDLGAESVRFKLFATKIPKE